MIIRESKYSLPWDIFALIVAANMAWISWFASKWYGSRTLIEETIIGVCILFVIGRLCSPERSVVKFLLEALITVALGLGALSSLKYGAGYLLIFVPIGIAALEIGNLARPSWVPLILAACLGGGLFGYGVYDNQKSTQKAVEFFPEQGPELAAQAVIPKVFETPPKLSAFVHVDDGGVYNRPRMHKRASFPGGEMLIDGEMTRSPAWHVDLTFPCSDGKYSEALLKAGVRPDLVKQLTPPSQKDFPPMWNLKDLNGTAFYDREGKRLRLSTTVFWVERLHKFVN